MNCAQVKEQLVDYLYGEMSAPARSAFADHLRGCPGCNAEVAGHEHALGHARAALTGPLLQEPPARVRLVVMEAAKTQARALRHTEDQERPGFFTRLLRTPWLLPAFGAASVATVIFVVRVLKNPEVVPGQTPTPILEESAPAAAPPPPVAPAPPEPSVAAELADQATQPSRQDEAKAVRRAKSASGKQGAPAPARKMRPASRDPFSGLQRGAGTASSKKADGFAEPPPWWDGERRSVREHKPVRSIDDLMGAVKDERPTPPPAAAEAPPPRSRPAPVREEKRAPEAAPTPVPSIAPPQPAAAPAPPPPPMAPAPSYAPPPKSRGADMDRMEDESAAAWEPSDKEIAKAKSPMGGKGAGPSLEESVRKADRLYANHDWSAAAGAYRDLLNRFPGYKDAAKWRERMNQSLVAEEKARDAKAGKAAKAKSSDVLLKDTK